MRPAVNKQSFTLVEILLALAILGIGLVSILSVFVVGSNSVRRTITLTEESFIAQMVMEDFKRQGHTTSGNLGSLSLSTSYSNYYNSYNVTLQNLSPVSNSTNLYKVDINVNKNNISSNYSTFITKYEP